MSSVKLALRSNQSSLKLKRVCLAYDVKDFERSFSDEISPFRMFRYNFKKNYIIKYINYKLGGITEYYDKFSGLKELKVIQEKTEEARQRLSITQEERRKAFSTLIEIQNNLRGIYSQLENTKRGDDHYIYLIKEEHKLLKKEGMQQEKLRDMERNERDQFISFSHLVTTSHEKEKAYAQKTKYWSVIGSMVGTIVGYLGSHMNSSKKQSELRKLIAESSNSNLEVELNKFLISYEQIGNASKMNTRNNENDNNKNKLLKDLYNKNTGNNNSQSHKHLDDLLSKINAILINLEENTKIMNKICDIYKFEQGSESGASLLLPMHLNSYKQFMYNENERMRTFLIKISVGIIIGTVLSRILF